MENQNEIQQNIFEQQPDPKPTGAPYVKDGDVIRLTDVVKIEDREFTFDDKVVKRKLYTFKDNTQLVVPVSLNNEIIAVSKANTGQLQAVQVKVEGAGKLKKYRAIIKL